MAEPEDKDDKYSIKAAARCLKLMDYATTLARPVTIGDVCKELDTNSNMAFRMLNTLATAGYMSRDEVSGGYRISLKSLLLSRSALQSLEIRRITMPYLELLWNQFPKANANLGVRYEDAILLIDRIDTQSLPRTYFTPGKELPFYCSGIGKVLTAFRSNQEIDNLIAKTNFKAYTAYTVTDPKKIKEELEQVRQEGVGRDREEFVTNDNCSAAPIRDAHGHVIAAISLSALETNMSQDEIEAALPKVKETADRISSLIGYDHLA